MNPDHASLHSCFSTGCHNELMYLVIMGAQRLSGRVLESRQRGRVFEPHWHHCVVSLSKNIKLSIGSTQKTRPFITERLLMGCKESNQTSKYLANTKTIFSFTKPWAQTCSNAYTLIYRKL